jgi:chromosomal replication initiation ATPase DnaA
MQLMYKYSGLSLSKVGDIAGRDHTTVIHAIHKVDAMCLYEKRFRLRYEKVLKNLIDKLHSKEN